MSRGDLRQKAEKLVQRGRLEAAIDVLRKVLKEEPDDTRTLNRVGDLYARLSRVDEAVELFSQAAERFSKEGFFVKAIAIYKKILRLDPTRMPIYGHLAELYRQQGLINEARAQYQVVADYYEKAEDVAAVVAVYEKLVELDLDDPEMRIQLGDLLATAERVDEALSQYRLGAKTLLEAGKEEAALQVLDRALEAAPDNLEFVMETVVGLAAEAGAELLERFVSAAEKVNPEARKAREVLASVAEAKPEPPAAEPEEAAEEEPEAAAEPEPVPPTEPEETEEVEIEIELSAFEEAVGERAEPEPAAEAGPEPEAAPAAPMSEAELDELLVEADALASYGLVTKACQRLESVLEHAPGNLGAYRRLIAIQADARRDTDVLRLAAQAATAALESGQGGAWRQIVADLSQRGFRIEGSKIIPPVEPEPQPEAPAELFVDAPESVETEPETETAAVAESRGRTAVETVEDELEELLAEVVEEEPEPAPEPTPQAPAAPEPEPEPAPVAAESEAEPGPDFFDLGAELAEELEAMEEDLSDTPQQEGRTVEEIVEGFKRGMAEVLSPKAYETHYNLGVAYREMGLVDEAIGEFQLAAKDPRYLVECCAMLGQCFQEKDFPDLAVKWYRKGLDSDQITEEESLGLLYELGNLHLVNGDRAAAREAFAEIYGSNSNFRDVVAKLEELRGD